MSLLGRFELVPGQHRPRLIRNGAIFLALVALVLVSGFGRRVPFWPDHAPTVTAHFRQAVSLKKGAPVRVAGIDVGTVKSIALDGPQGGVTVTMRIDGGQHLGLRRDARAHLYWRTLLGRNMYIQLDPGTAREPLGGADIPRRRTTTQVEFDQLLQPFDDGGRRALQRLTRSFQQGFADPAPPEHTIDALAPAMRAIGRGAGALRGTHTGDLTRLVDNAGRALGALSRDDDALAGTIDHGDTVLAATAAQHASVGALLDRAPGAEQRTQTTMASLRGTLARLDPLVDELRPGARGLQPAVSAVRPALRAATPLLSRARPLLARLRPAVTSLGRAGRVGVPLFGALDPTLDRTRDPLIPWLNERDSDTELKNGEAIGPWFSGADAVASRFDTNGYVLRMQPGASAQSLDSLPCQVALSDPSAAQLVRCATLKRTLGRLLGTPPTTRKGR